jgi:4-hydroxy-tetrahydrodipicolinate synthase
MGGLGVISVVSNIFPCETVALTQAALAGDFDTASALQSQLAPIIELLFSEVNPIPVKYAMKHIGFDCGNCRLPLGRINPELKDKIDKYFKS